MIKEIHGSGNIQERTVWAREIWGLGWGSKWWGEGGAVSWLRESVKMRRSIGVGGDGRGREGRSCKTYP